MPSALAGSAGRRFAAGAALALSAVWVANLIAVISEFTLPVPVSDHWGALQFLLEALERGEPLSRILWSQHNEHRIAVEWLAELAVLQWGHGNFRPEAYLSIALAAATAGWAWWTLAKPLRAQHPVWAWWILPGTLALALSPAQMENWIDPFHLMFFTLNLGVLGGLVLLGTAPLTALRFASAALCGAVATASFGSGLLFWPVALLPLWANTHRSRRVPVLGGWIGLSALVWGAYLWDFKSPASHPSLLALLDAPWATLRFFLVLAGNPVGAFVRPQDAIALSAVPAFGLAGLALLAGVLLRAGRRLCGDPRRMVWLALAVYALLTAATITLARVGFGLVAAFPTRYVGLLWPLWMGTLALLTLEQVHPAGHAQQAGQVHEAGQAQHAGQAHEAGQAQPRKRPWPRFPLAQAAWAALIVLGIATFNTHVQRWRPFVRDFRAAAAELPDVCEGNATLIGRLGPPDLVAQALPVLVRHGLLSYAPEAFAASAEERPPEPSPGAVEETAIETVRLEPAGLEPRSAHGGRCLRIAGHVPPTAARAPEVLAVAGNRVLKRGWVGPLRPRAGPDYDADPRPESGWALYIGTARLSPGLERLEVYAVLGEGRTLRLGTVQLPPGTDPGAAGR
jgi:hypothetical protein